MGTATGIGPSQKKLSIIDFKKKEHNEPAQNILETQIDKI